jgi:hypothetical protein
MLEAGAEAITWHYNQGQRVREVLVEGAVLLLQLVVLELPILVAEAEVALLVQAITAAQGDQVS